MSNGATLIVALLLSFGGAEVLLRAAPSLIGIEVLARFHEDLRTPIADRLGFATSKERRPISSEERGDGGPPFHIYFPDRLYVGLADPVDMAAGAVVERSMDDKGFCNPPAAAGHETVDVLMIGDSFTTCTLVRPEDTFSAQIERQTGLRTYNLGVGALGPYEQLVLLRNFGLPLRPRIVVLNIYEGNDLRDIVRYLDFVQSGVISTGSDRMGGPFAVSYALAFLKSNVELIVKRFKTRKINFLYSVDVQGMRTSMNVSNDNTDEVKYARRVKKGEVSLDLFAGPLEMFVELAARNAFIPVVTLHPSAQTGYSASVRFEDEAVGRDVAAFSEALRAYLSENAERIGYRFIDVVPAFREQVKSRPIAFFPANVHFTRDGHAIVASVLGPALQALLSGR